MKASKARRQDKFNAMSWEWLDADTVLVTLVDNKAGKSGRFKAKIKDGRVTKILEDEEMR